MLDAIDIPPPFATLAAIVILTAAYFGIGSYRWHRKYKLPPTIAGAVPIFGNLFQTPSSGHGPWAREQALKYGEMFTVKFGLTTWVFLNSSKHVRALMERRANIYCSRPPFPFTGDIMSSGCRMVLMPYSERWRAVRKVMHNILSTRQRDTFKPYQDLESRHLLWDYLHHPARWFSANARYSNSVIMSVVFGKRMDLDNPHTAELMDTIEMFLGNQQPGTNIVDAFPILARILPAPLQWWRARGKRYYEFTRGVYKRELEAIKARMAAGTQRDCFAKDFLETKEAQDFGETQTLFVLGTLMEAGTDTSRLTVIDIVAGAAAYPDWVARARAQLDAVCGARAERLPGWDDRDRLPYITAVVKEGFRWRPNIAEMGVPTSLIRDDEYEGYRFPAGTVFTWNAWALALDPEEYPEPERFWPDRFLNEDLNNPMKGHWGFGPGRRVCVGWNVGEMNVWIAIARLLYCFDFEEDPNEPIDTMNIPQLNKGKAPFKVNIKPRSEEHADLIRRDCASAVDTKY
ncbi:putative cytochrome p450 protein [Neofusicoccum parvum UCRNP2]|uniref:Putative cytochrome p450 protein n=1 Tax=Botryosphaeria parva (strain UCR-NP2) TaxID=1287680 RepID=R1G6L4_BOTPV|nr:putative cytochrome p450 protein [Neofusicoccum parvum UCRNP2]